MTVAERLKRETKKGTLFRVVRAITEAVKFKCINYGQIFVLEVIFIDWNSLTTRTYLEF